MDKSSPKIRVDSPKWETHFKGSRATELADPVERLKKEKENLRVKIHWVNEEFDEYSRQLFWTLKERDTAVNRARKTLEALQYALNCYEHERKVCNKLDEKINTATLELRDGNLNAEREQSLQETIETLTEIREELLITKDVERLLNKCRLHKAELKRLTASKTHVMLLEKLVQITESRKKVYAEIQDFRIRENIEED